MKKRTTTRRKTAAPVRRKRTVTRRKKGMLSELFNPNMAQASAKTVLSGAVGGVGAAMLTKVLPDTMDPKTKSFYTLGGAFVTATLLKMPNVAAGMAGVGMVNLLTNTGMLAEDGYSYADDIEALPMVLNENPGMYLQEDMYLQENMYLQEAGLYPEYDYASFGIDA